MESNGTGISARRRHQSVAGEYISTRSGYVLDETAQELSSVTPMTSWLSAAARQLQNEHWS